MQTFHSVCVACLPSHLCLAQQIPIIGDGVLSGVPRRFAANVVPTVNTLVTKGQGPLQAIRRAMASDGLVRVVPDVRIKVDSNHFLCVNQYTVKATIGRGSFSEVVLAEANDEHVVRQLIMIGQSCFDQYAFPEASYFIYLAKNIIFHSY